MPVNRNEQRQPHAVHIYHHSTFRLYQRCTMRMYNTPIGRNVATFLLIDVLNFPDSTQSEQKRKLRLAICPPSLLQYLIDPACMGWHCKFNKNSPFPKIFFHPLPLFRFPISLLLPYSSCFKAYIAFSRVGCHL